MTGHRTINGVLGVSDKVVRFDCASAKAAAVPTIADWCAVDLVEPDAEDAHLVEQAGRERRVLLTQDRGLLMRRALWAGAYVRGHGADAQSAGPGGAAAVWT